MQRITPFLWFDHQAEEAANFYVSVFKNSKVKQITHYTGEEPSGMKGKVMTVDFELDGQQFVALNGGPQFKFTEAISLFVKCKDQAEVDLYWNKFLASGGREDNCGWLQDKWGVSWQIIPDALGRYLSDPDREKANRALQAMLKMKKIIVADLDKAFAG